MQNKNCGKGKQAGKSQRSALLRFIKEHVRLVLGITVAIVFGILWFVIEVHPAFLLIRNSFFYNLLRRIILSAVLLYFTWFYKNKSTIFGKILATVVVLPIWFPYFIASLQIRLLIINATFFVLLGYVLYRYLIRKNVEVVLIAEAFYYFLGLLGYDYTFLHSPGALRHWELSLLVAIVVAVITVILLVKGHIELINDSLTEKIALPFVIAFMTFFIILFTANNFNYALDTEPPRSYVWTVEDKDFSGRQSKRYDLYFTFQGERVRLSVSRSIYQDIEIGDSFPVLYYEGAFNDPFFIPNEKEYQNKNE